MSILLTRENIKKVSEVLDENLSKRQGLLNDLKTLRAKIDEALIDNDVTRVNEFHEELHRLENEWDILTEEFNEIQKLYGPL